MWVLQRQGSRRKRGGKARDEIFDDALQRSVGPKKKKSDELQQVALLCRAREESELERKRETRKNEESGVPAPAEEEGTTTAFRLLLASMER